MAHTRSAPRCHRTLLDASRKNVGPGPSDDTVEHPDIVDIIWCWSQHATEFLQHQQLISFPLRITAVRVHVRDHQLYLLSRFYGFHLVQNEAIEFVSIHICIAQLQHVQASFYLICLFYLSTCAQ